MRVSVAFLVKLVAFVSAVYLMVSIQQFRVLSGTKTSSLFSAEGPPLVHVKSPCAINLYGLPRSFKSLVLPSLLKNVVKPKNRLQQDEHDQEDIDQGGHVDLGQRLLSLAGCGSGHPQAHLRSAVPSDGAVLGGQEVRGEAVELDPEFDDGNGKGAAKKAMVEIFDILGPEDPVANDYRFRLSLLLFS